MTSAAYYLAQDTKDKNDTMIGEQLLNRGITDKSVLSAFHKIPREYFVPARSRNSAYYNAPQPIGFDQTISQPYMVALMTQVLALSGIERVLEIGTGSGYQTAILSVLARKVYSIERIRELSAVAGQNLKKISSINVKLFVGDGSVGLKEYEPFERIIITCSVPFGRIEESPLPAQLTKNGFILAPIGNASYQELTKIYTKGHTIYYEKYGGCRFVKMLGIYGWE